MCLGDSRTPWRELIYTRLRFFTSAFKAFLIHSHRKKNFCWGQRSPHLAAVILSIPDLRPQGTLHQNVPSLAEGEGTSHNTQHLAGQPGFHRKSRSPNSFILPHNTLILTPPSQPLFPGPASGMTISFSSADETSSPSFHQYELNSPCLHYSTFAVTRKIWPLVYSQPCLLCTFVWGWGVLEPFLTILPESQNNIKF